MSIAIARATRLLMLLLLSSFAGGALAESKEEGRTENALRRLPFKASYMFRPGVIQPMHGARSKTRVSVRPRSRTRRPASTSARCGATTRA